MMTRARAELTTVALSAGIPTRVAPGSPPARPVESYVHGLDGPLCLVEGREAMALLAFGGLDAWQREHRGANAHLDRAVAKLRLASAAYRAGSGISTSPAEPPEPAPRSDGRLTTRQAATQLGVTPRAITKAINEGRLRAEWFAGRWLIDAATAARYRAN
jgi:excisionase family DNA binding protein